MCGANIRSCTAREEKFRSPGGTPLDKARAEHAAWAAKVKGRIGALRAGDQRVDLTQQQADALAGDWYREFTAKHTDNPGSPEGYDIVRGDLWSMAVNAGDRLQRYWNAAHAGTGGQTSTSTSWPYRNLSRLEESANAGKPKGAVFSNGTVRSALPRQEAGAFEH
jgi:hypothetical protein